jgi:hypothetical protein
MNNKVKFIKILSLACVLSLISISIQSCKDDDKPPTGTTTTDDNDTDPLAGKDYLKFEGYKLEFNNPTIGTVKGSESDTTLEWRGNKPSTSAGDTAIFILHPALDSELNPIISRKLGTYTPVFSDADEGQIQIYIRFSDLDGRPRVNITGGTYELKRVDGKWVSILKNGKGTWTKDNGDKVNYTGIELKATWPN